MPSNNKLLLTSYLLIGLIATFIAVKFYQVQSRALALRTPEQLLAPPPRMLVSNKTEPRTSSRSLAVDLQRQRSRIAELQRLLSEREETLNLQVRQLELRTSETQRLNQEADRYFAILIDLLNESDTIDNATIAAGLPTLESAQDMDDLGFMTETTEPAVESLENELAAADWELAELKSKEEQTQAALLEATNRTTSFQQALINRGEMAVPILIDMLANEDAELRVWAASALAEVGKSSPMAIDALLIAADDEDTQVQQSAVAAIASINRG